MILSALSTMLVYWCNHEMTAEILLCVYLLHCKLEPNQCNIEESNKHRIGWLKVDDRRIRMEIVSLQELDLKGYLSAGALRHH